ncbi:MAG: nuclear transport factor 2 family protein [Thermoleophilia bacterium]
MGIVGESIAVRADIKENSTMNPDRDSEVVKEEIWALEEAYFTSLYKADYNAVLALVHGQFLGWPGDVPQPVDREGSARFMRQLIPGPTSCTRRIERWGIQVLGAVALTQYVIHVNFSEAGAAAKTQSSRITHTWVKEGGSWKLLGGMSIDQ